MNIAPSSLSYSIRRCFVDEFFTQHVSALLPRSRVLDLGGVRVAKRGRFDMDQYDLTVVALNISRDRKPDVQADAALTPFEDACFDSVICAELFEHVPNPAGVLHEIHRVLRENGRLLITAPFLHPMHADPEDYGRYTSHYWRWALREAGFDDVLIEPQGLFFSTIMHFSKLFLNKACPRPFRGWVGWMMRLLQRWATQCERKPCVSAHPFFNSFTTGFGIQAIKA